MVNDIDMLIVTTRAQPQEERVEQEEEVVAATQEVPKTKSILGGVTRRDVRSEPNVVVATEIVCEKEKGLDRMEVVGGVLCRQEEDVVQN